MRFVSLQKSGMIIVLYLSIIGAVKATNLPPILDFYPICQYSVKDTISVKRRINDRLKKSSNPNSINYETNLSAITEETKIALESLQRIALKNKAVALVLVSRNLDYSPLKGRPGVYLRYRAELISDCDDLSPNTDSSAPIASHGNKILSRYSKKQIVSTQSTFGGTRKNEKLSVKNRDVSLKSGVYGIKLGSSIEQIYAKIGEPSSYVDLLKGEPVLGYGRYHWFHFQDGKLVRIENQSSLLGQTSINLIPYRSFFDDNPWRINSHIELNTSLESVKQLLPASQFDKSTRQMILEDSDKRLVLKFTAVKDPNTEIIDYFLESFSLQEISYMQKPKVKLDYIKQQNDVIQKTLADLSDQRSFSMETFKQQMGKVIAKIQLKGDEKVYIFSPSLYIKQTTENLSEIRYVDHLLDEKFLHEQIKPWSINDFYVGQPYELAKNYFSKDGYATSEIAEIETPTHLIELRFEEQQKANRVNEITVYLF